MEDFINSRSEFSKIYANAFIKHFGEERVEVTPNGEKGVQVVVYFPEVKVENEHRDSIMIYDLFTLVKTSANGNILPSVYGRRSTFTREQAQSNYVHSHLPSIYNRTDAKCWKDWCLGSGPITRTFSNLMRFEADNNLEQISLYANLLCMELDNLVKVESLFGGPYIRLDSVREMSETELQFSKVSINDDIFHTKCKIHSYYYHAYSFSTRSSSRIAEDVFVTTTFSKILPKVEFRFKTSNGIIDFAEDFTDTVIKISNAFLDECNTLFFSDDIIRKYFYKARLINGEIKYIESDRSRISGYIPVGELSITFKGKPFHFKLTENEVKEEDKEDVFLMLDPVLITYFISTILYRVNHDYEKFR